MRVVGAVTVASLLVGCGGPSPPAPPFASLVDAAGPPRDAWVAVGDALPTEAGDSGAAGAEVPAPPSTPCNDDVATETPVCPSPPPACVNSHVAVDYNGGTCSSGFCTWQASTVDCREVDASCAGAAGLDGGFSDAGPDGAVWMNVSGCLLSVPAGPNPSPLACDADASPATPLCPLPPSACADGEWLVYYDDGQCVAGACAWQKRYRFCGGSECIGGACGSIGTPPPPATPQ
ncbi:MAG: hypothetical protein ACLP1X_30525 [Polyangiaceae bacterium]